jgi:ribosome-binding factor A
MSPSGGRRRAGAPRPGFSRLERVNEVLREVLAEEIERLSDLDERLALVTVTAVRVEPDLRHATVLLAEAADEAALALGQYRVRLQQAIGRQVRLKRTPQLGFAPDPVLAQARRIEEVLHDLKARGELAPSPPERPRRAGEPGDRA